MNTVGNDIETSENAPVGRCGILSNNDTGSVKSCYNIVDDALLPVERRSFATNVLLGLAARKNDWSTYDDLAAIYNQYKPDNLRKTNINIRENVGDWNRKVKNEKIGNMHEGSDDERADGCKLNKPHRVCRKDPSDGPSLFRIHPEFAEEVFTASNLSMDEFLQKRGEKHIRKRRYDTEELLKKQQKRALKSLRTKMAELKKLKQTLHEHGVDIEYTLKINFLSPTEMSPSSPSSTSSAPTTTNDTQAQSEAEY